MSMPIVLPISVPRAEGGLAVNQKSASSPRPSPPSDGGEGVVAALQLCDFCGSVANTRKTVPLPKATRALRRKTRHEPGPEKLHNR